MAKLILAMNVSVDGYIDDHGGNLVMEAPSPKHFQFWIDTIKGHAGTIYGRVMYQVMQYWDVDQPGWGQAEHDFAAAWRAMPKWVVSRTLNEVGPNATLITGDVGATVRELKDSIDGVLSVSGPKTAGLMTELGLVDEYHLHVRPFVLGEGKPFFDAARPPLKLKSHSQIDDDTMHLVYVPRE